MPKKIKMLCCFCRLSELVTAVRLLAVYTCTCSPAKQHTTATRALKKLTKVMNCPLKKVRALYILHSGAGCNWSLIEESKR